ncbi:MAG: hypothetical protein Ct9H300mP32_2520 [Verrucomicrobiota bacterium]|nr:MAG: hypothetical protein Ct9H300mP32_2520 [Verrucomicrobiota bacterium]
MDSAVMSWLAWPWPVNWCGVDKPDDRRPRGAAMAPQTRTMKVTEQIDALRTLATSPVDYLVAPRLLAMFISLPLLTAEAIPISLFPGCGGGIPAWS